MFLRILCRNCQIQKCHPLLSQFSLTKVPGELNPSNEHSVCGRSMMILLLCWLGTNYPSRSKPSPAQLHFLGQIQASTPFQML